MREEIDYLYQIPRFAKKASVDNTKELLRRLGNPERGMKVIHVAGTNGKGSVCCYLNEILIASGVHTGLFTSPHLVDIRERIRIDGRMVSEALFEEAFAQVKTLAIQMAKDGYEHPSYFEFLFGMGMYVYGKCQVEYLILETGLGGRLDATNAIEHPILTMITSISLDHTDILGDTLSQIAAEKAGIIKAGVPVVFWEGEEESNSVIRNMAQRQKAPCYPVNTNLMKDLTVGDNQVDFSLENGYYKNETFCVHGRARYQAENATLALMGCQVALPFIGREFLHEGLIKAVWMGRMQAVSPHFVIDGGHNEDGIRRFLEAVGRDGVEGPRVLMLSAVADKHYQDMLRSVCESGYFARLVVCQLQDARGLKLEAFRQELQQYPKVPVTYYQTVEQAYKKAREYEQEGAMVYVAGSLYLAGEVLLLVSKETGEDYD